MKKQFSKKNILPLCILSAGVLCVLYYIFFKEKFEFNSDFTDTVIWAEAMLTGNGLYDARMNYAYILPFGGSLLMVPFVAVFGVSYLAHALGFVLFLAIFTVCLFFCLKTVGLSTNESMSATGIILMLSCVSNITRMIMWGHIIHYSLGVLFVLAGIIMFSKIRITGDKISLKNKSTLIPVIIFAIFCMLCSFNGFTIILFFLIPLIGAIIIERFIDLKKDIFCTENINTLIVVIIAGGAGGIGLLLNILLCRHVTTVYDDIFENIPMWQHWVWDISERLQTYMTLICGENPADVSMKSFTGIKLMLLALLAYVTILTPFTAFISYKKFENKFMRILVLSHAILVFSSMFILNFSAAKGTSWRITGIYISSVIVTAVYTAWLFKTNEYRRFSVVLSAFLAAISLITLYNVTQITAPGGINRFERLGTVLCENGLTQGYAEYWSAQVTTVLSDSKAVVCPISVKDDGSLNKFSYNIRDDQFSQPGRYFLFLSEYEYNTLDPSYKDKSTDLIKFDEDGYILVFDEALF